jgi:hypothetical protein
MALYIPTSTRRKRAMLAVGVALVLGVGMGILFGRLTAPSIDKQVAVVRADARKASASLRVLALHDQAGAVSNQAGDGGAGLVLDQTGGKLGDLFASAPWLAADKRTALRTELATLDSMPDRTGVTFGAAAETLADHIDATFGAG